MTPTIKIDPKMLASFSSKDIADKKDRIGFYKLENQTYVITTQQNTNDPSFTDDVRQIAHLFAKAQLSTDDTFSAHDSFKLLKYMDCVYRVIDRRNEKVALKKTDPLLNFLSKIPLISSIVSWILDQMKLTKPSSFIRSIQNLQTHLFKKQLGSALELENLISGKNNLIKKMNASHNKLAVYADIEINEEDRGKDVESAFEEEIFKRSENLQLAQKILANEVSALNFEPETDPLKAASLFKARKKAVIPSENYFKLTSASQKKMIADAKIKIVEEYYRQHVQRVKDLIESSSKQPEEPDLHMVLIAADADAFSTKFYSLVLHLQKLHPTATNEINFIKKRFKGYVENLIAEAENLSALKSIKDKLLTQLNSEKTKREKQYETYVDKNFWEEERNFIQTKFEKRLIALSPALTRATQICTASDSFEAILGFTLQEPAENAGKQYLNINKSLEESAELKPMLGLTLGTLCKNAKDKVYKKYGQWHAQRIISECSQAKVKGTKPQALLSILLLTQNPNEFEEKINRRAKHLTDSNELEALSLLHGCYENYFFSSFEELRLSLENPKQLFMRAENQAAVNAEMIKKNKILENWLNCKKINQPNFTVEEHTLHKQKLQAAYDFYLTMTIPVFGIAQEVLGLKQKFSGDPTLLLIGGASAKPVPVTGKTERWYINQISLLQSELSDPTLAEISQDRVEIINKALLHLRLELSGLKQKELEKNLAKTMKTETLFGTKLPSFFTDFLEKKPNIVEGYKEIIKNGLNIKKSDQIEKAYQDKLKEISHLANSEAQKEMLAIAYENYKRALILQPLLDEVSGIVYEGKVSLDELVGKRNSLNLLDVEKYMGEMTALIEQEIYIQKKMNTKSPVLAKLETIKSQLESQWHAKIAKAYPIFNKMIQINKKFPVPSCNMHSYIFNTPFTGKSQLGQIEKVKDLHKEFKDFNAAGNTDLPQVLMEASINCTPLVQLAYKEWEADRILSCKLEESPYDSSWEMGKKTRKYNFEVLGLSCESSFEVQTARYKELFFLLHPDKNRDAPPEMKEKFTEASKRLVAPAKA